MKERKGPPGGEGRGERVLGENRRILRGPANTHLRLKTIPRTETFPPHDAQTPRPSDSNSKLLAALSAASDELDAALENVQEESRGLRRLRSGAQAAPPLVLVVDDNPDTRELYAQSLRAGGFRTATAENGRAAIEKALALKPRAILLDYCMPVMDGAGAARILQADARTSGIPILLVTAMGAPPGAVLSVPCLPKPALPDEVVDTVRALIDSTKGEECG